MKTEKGFGYDFKTDCKRVVDKALTTSADLKVTCPDCLKILLKKKGDEIRFLMQNLEKAQAK